MPYRTKIKIGGFGIGSIVPDEKALIWEKMYKDSPVEYFEELQKEVVQLSTFVPDSKEQLDINHDGKIDKMDKSLAGKVLGSLKKKSRY